MSGDELRVRRKKRRASRRAARVDGAVVEAKEAREGARGNQEGSGIDRVLATVAKRDLLRDRVTAELMEQSKRRTPAQLSGEWARDALKALARCTAPRELLETRPNAQAGPRSKAPGDVQDDAKEIAAKAARDGRLAGRMSKKQQAANGGAQLARHRARIASRKDVKAAREPAR